MLCAQYTFSDFKKLTDYKTITRTFMALSLNSYISDQDGIPQVQKATHVDFTKPF